MIKKTLTLTGSPEGFTEAVVVVSTHPMNGDSTSGEAAAHFYIDDQQGLFFTLEEVKAMHKFFGDIIYAEGGEW